MKRRERTRLNDFNKLWENNTFVIPKTREIDIVSLKVKALYENISMDELYMVLYNYLKHRGISYLEDAVDDSVSGGSAYADGLKLNTKEMEEKFPCEIQKDRLEKLENTEVRHRYMIRMEINCI
jgi:CRISPR-associated endonuclease Csn1